MRVDHIGYAVANMERAMCDMEQLGFAFNNPIDDVDRNVQIAFGKNGEYKIELVCPMNKSLGSPVDLQLSKMRSGPYHLCFVADGFEEDITALIREGFRLTVPPKPAVAFGGRRVAFLYSLGGGLIELVESA